MAAQVQQLERQKLLHEKCQDTTAAKKKPKPKRVIVPVRFKIEERHRVMYCDVPKVKTIPIKTMSSSGENNQRLNP
jgi:hypothetical protein